MAGKPSGKGPRGVRLNPQQTERTRAAIAATQIIKRLNCFVLGKEDDAGHMVEMQPHQVTAAIALLRKVIPDLSTVDGTMNVTVSRHEDAMLEIEQSITGPEIHGLPN